MNQFFSLPDTSAIAHVRALLEAAYDAGDWTRLRQLSAEMDAWQCMLLSPHDRRAESLQGLIQPSGY